MFQKGHKKVGGRKKGRTNKSTRAKELLKQIVDNEIVMLPNILQNFSPYERIAVLKCLLPYVYAKKQEIDVKSEISALLSNIENLTESQLTRLKEIIEEVKTNNVF